MTCSDPARHEISECALAWQTLRMAHDRVAQRLGAELSDECGLAINEFDVLLFLRSHAHEQVRIGALLDAVPLSQPALSRLVSRLEARGLLARREAEDDARAVVVCLTDTGTALIDRALAIHARVVDETLTSKFSESERTALLQTLNQIAQ
ncbi:MAG TPA: MarR family winged helix-turn-helix transcriptional regulator [Thermomicrobiales bacterium]|nr:MarR family winged helix-turn-helix transcriptional regulator [Thermomicrobiales bacterium]